MSRIPSRRNPVETLDPNPFVKKAESKPVVEALGPNRTGIVEHILVPPDALAEWMLENDALADAVALRELVGGWLADGSAILDHTGIGVGTWGNASTLFESTLELIYPTEYVTNGPEVWPLPTAFETRNLGYSLTLDQRSFGDNPTMEVNSEVTEQVGSDGWHPLSARTRQPGDVFLPRIRTMRSNQPFRLANQAGEPIEALAQGQPVLLGRYDPLPDERAAGGLSRLVFYRNGTSEPADAPPPSDDARYLSLMTFNVDHRAFSEWLQVQDPAAVPLATWEFVNDLRKQGKATLQAAIDGATGPGRHENIREVSYPTEWKPSNISVVQERWEVPAPGHWEDGKRVQGVATMAKTAVEAFPGMAGASVPTAFETRNTGLMLEIEVLPSRSDSFRLVAEQVREVGEAVHRRIEVDGEWIPDVKFPLFTVNRVNTVCRIPLGEWMLLYCGSPMNEGGRPDREQCLLMFIKRQ